MPRFAQLFKDTSPPLVWSDGWQGGSSETDSALDQYVSLCFDTIFLDLRFFDDRYSQATYTYTQKKGANMTFTFNGTFVGIYGAKRPGHGKYQIKLDNHVYPTFDASSSVAVYNQTLFNATIPNGQHTITLINAEDATLDVDYVRFWS